jgi:glycosyltransferase involved in cell wall biosynthesis
MEKPPLKKKKIAMLVPGTGNFFCGSCLRDHSLAKGLIQLNHDVTMVPLYLPHVSEDGVKTAPLFFGGINVFLQQFSFLRILPHWLNRFLDNNALLTFISRFAGFTSAKTLGALTLSSFHVDKSGQNIEFKKMVRWLATELKPDCLILSNCLLAGFAKTLKKELQCPVYCTLQGEDSFLDSLVEPYRSQSWEALRECSQDIDLFMPVSDTYGRIMSERLDLDLNKVKTVYNGIDLNGIPHDKKPDDNFTIAYLANIIPEKGLGTLVDAFILLRKKYPETLIRLMILGSTTPFTKNYLKSIITKLEHAGVYNEVIIKTNLSKDEKFSFLSKASVLSVPATYGESFGLYILEALAVGVPVVQPDHGAFPELIEKIQGGLICKANDVEDLAEKIFHLIENPELRLELGQKGKQVVLNEFNNLSMAKRVLELIR